MTDPDHSHAEPATRHTGENQADVADTDTSSRSPADTAPFVSGRRPGFAERHAGTARIVAMTAGIVGILLALLSPFLPVDYTKAELTWPQQGSVANVAAPNVSFVPVSMDVTVPCALGASLPASGGVLLSTVPEGGAEAGKVGLFVRATADSLQVVQRNVVLLNTPRAAAQSAPDCRIVVESDTEGTRGSIQGLPENAAGAGPRPDG